MKALPSPILAVFSLMSVAEEVLGAAETRLSRKLPGVFAALRPPELLRGKSEDLYRGHCEELVARAERGEDLRPGTLAEVAAACSAASLRAPLDSAGLALYEHCFVTLFGHLPGGGERAREQWPGQLEEDLAAARRKTAQDWRRPT